MRRILVGYDGSEGARRALERAIGEAQTSRGRITIVSIVNVPLALDTPRNFGTLDDISPLEGAPLSAPPDIVEHLSEARERLAAAGLDGELTWAAGPPADVLLETARRMHADVIVVGEHHHGFLARHLGGDVGAELQQDAHAEVILA